MADWRASLTVVTRSRNQSMTLGNDDRLAASVTPATSAGAAGFLQCVHGDAIIAKLHALVETRIGNGMKTSVALVCSAVMLVLTQAPKR